MSELNKWDKRYLALAKEVASWSKDPSTQVGAVTVGNKKEVPSQGFNGFPRGIIDSKDRYNNRETKYKYVVHAEMNAIYNATYSGVSLDGAVLYVYGLPICSECAKVLFRLVLKKLLSRNLRNWITGMKVSLFLRKCLMRLE